MSRTLHILIFFLLLASCSNEETLQPSGIDWTPDVSRSVTGGQELRIVGRQDGTPLFDKILIPAEAGGKASWKDGKPVWGTETVDLIAFAPAGGGLPSSITHDGVTEYLIDYHGAKTKTDAPKHFELTQLMAQLKVHIWLEETEVHTPENDSVYLHTKADIDFPNKGIKNLATRKHVCLGAISQSGTLEQDGYHFDKFSMVEPLVVLPQTIPAGEEVLWFSIEDAHYYYKPEEPIELKPGYLTNLTLHVVFIEEESGEPVEPPTKKVISIDRSTVTITPWETGETINGEIINPDNN